MKTTSLFIFILVGSLLYSVRSAKCETFCVDTEEMLQNALNTAAINNKDDEIQIVQGTYYGNFTFSSTEDKTIRLKGGYLKQEPFFCYFPKPAPFPSSTIIDGEQKGRVLTLRSDNNYSSTVAVSWLTIKNGKSNVDGGGIRIISRSYGNNELEVELRNNIIEDNIGTDLGGGVAIHSNAYSSDGGIIWIADNTVRNNETDGKGGGVWIKARSLSGRSGFIALEGNIINNNNALESSGGAYIESYGINGTGWISIVDNRISGNKTGSPVHAGPGGIFIKADTESTELGTIALTNNIISANTTNIIGGGILFDVSSQNDTGNIILINNTITENYSGGIGGGILYQYKQPIEFINNIITGNHATSGGDIYLDSNAAAARAHHNDFSDVFGLWQYESNNINLNPQFIGQGNFHLQSSSPCRDKGTTNYVLPANDIDGDARIIGKAPDMGADELPPLFHWPMFLPAITGAEI
jgi:hypothetical protein